MTEKDFVCPKDYVLQQEGAVAWSAPSNIALIKYWGKYEPQLPANPSLSFTLETCISTTRLRYRKLGKKASDYSFDFNFHGVPHPGFSVKLRVFFERIEAYLPFLKEYHLEIESDNSFPHSSGIASSASGFAALALCLVSFEASLRQIDPVLKRRKASFLARLGSGSACRSTEGGIMVWGHHPDIPGSSDLYGLPYPLKWHKVFTTYQDTILLVQREEKQVSSTAGHRLMETHPFATPRFRQANSQLSALVEVLGEGDLNGFIGIVESEALSLHAMMMTGKPYYLLMKPNTLAILEALWKFRKDSGLHPAFSLDAGANVHLLYPLSEKEAVLDFVRSDLIAYCENGQYICDQIGDGAKKV